jgi:hypothetical protein
MGKYDQGWLTKQFDRARQDVDDLSRWFQDKQASEGKVVALHEVVSCSSADDDDDDVEDDDN